MRIYGTELTAFLCAYGSAKAKALKVQVEMNAKKGRFLGAKAEEESERRGAVW